MSIHIFSFEQEYPNPDEFIYRLKISLEGIQLSTPTDLQDIAYALFVERKDVTLLLQKRKIANIIISSSPSGYDRGSLITLTTPGTLKRVNVYEANSKH